MKKNENFCVLSKNFNKYWNLFNLNNIMFDIEELNFDDYNVEQVHLYA
jgi:hypothetical protein